MCHGQNMSEIEITTLDNGLRIATATMTNVQTASVGVWVDVGARHETPEINGVAHMLEHMAFKGTERRSARALAEEIENVGGQLNAYTSREQTAYYARVLAEDVPLAVDLLADILQHSVFDEEELARERGVVVQEIGQVQDTPDDLVFDQFQETAFPGQALGRSILGPSEIVAAMPRTALVDYMARHYGPRRMVLGAAGKIEHERVVELGDRLFRELPAAGDDQGEPAEYRGGEMREERDLEQAHLLIGLPAFSYADDDFYALQVLSAMLGGGMSSRLFQEVRENRGLAYSIFSFASSYRDTGFLGIYAGTGEQETAELVPVMCEETMKLIDAPTEAELVRARAQLKASLMMALESCFAQSEELARQLLIFNRRIPPEEIIAKIDAVDIAAIRRVGRRLLTGAGPTLAAIGPLGKLPSLDAIRGYLVS
jgi:predicted Zn-dependent peptidase